MKLIKDISYSPIGNKQQTLDLYLPDCKEFPLFVYFHGGGIEAGSKDNPREVEIAEYLTQKGIAVISANYRMYPTAVYPEFIKDAAEAVAWAHNNIANYGKCTGFYVGGSSAGAYLSQMLCFDKKYLAPYALDPVNFDGFIHNAGQPTAHFNVLRERGIDSRRVIIDETAPIYHIGTSPEYAPMMILVATNDMKNRYEQTQLLVSTLKHFQYDITKVDFRVLEGTHCNYTEKHIKELIYEYINKSL